MTAKLFKKLALTAVLASAFGAANAAYLPFSITEDGIPGADPATISNLGKIVGGYSELFQVTSGTPTAGTFSTSAYWNAGQFYDVAGTTDVTGTTQLASVAAENARNSNLYSLYGVFQSNGSYSTSGGVTSFTGSTGEIHLYIDPSRNTGKSLTNGFSLPTLTNTGDDIEVAFSTLLLGGNGNIQNGGGFQGGFLLNFGKLTLTDPAGKAYFTSPSDFYMYVDITGQFNPFTPDPTAINGQPINGSADVYFKVPEPSLLGLLGLGLFGVGAFSRRKNAS